MDRKIVDDTTPDALIRILKDEIPTLEVASFKTIADSWDNKVFEINDTYIFRFPKEKDYPFEAEVNVLRYIRGKISLEVPHVVFVGKEYLYMGYPKIFGKIISDQEMKLLPKNDKEQIASGAAKFLFEFHSAVPVDVAKEMGVKETRMSTFADKILPTIPDHFPNDAALIRFSEDAVRQYHKMITDDYPNRVLHWDLHNGNMVLNDDFSLKGVIDFGDVEIGDIHTEFHALYKFDTDITGMALTAYEKMSGLKLSIERVRVYSWINELSDIAEKIEDPSNRAYQKSMGRVRQWMTEV